MVDNTMVVHLQQLTIPTDATDFVETVRTSDPYLWTRHSSLSWILLDMETMKGWPYGLC